MVHMRSCDNNFKVCFITKLSFSFSLTQFAGIFIIDYVVYGKTTVSLMPTDLSRKAWLKSIDTLVQSHVVSVDMVRQSWTYLPSRVSLFGCSVNMLSLK